MNPYTGEIKLMSELEKLPAYERAKFIEVKRDLTKLEELKGKIALYAPCACGSGKKFKFCCHKTHA